MESRFATFSYPLPGLRARLFPLRLHIVSLAFALLTGAYCVEPVVIQNYPEYLPESRTAVIRKQGYVMAVSESQRWGDSLQLLPGRYLLEFREKFTGIQGAALCQVEAGGIYEIEIVRKRYMEMAGRYVYEGKCNRLNNPLPPGSTEYPEEEDKKAEPVTPLDTYDRPETRENSTSESLQPSDDNSSTDDPVLQPDDGRQKQSPDSRTEPQNNDDAEPSDPRATVDPDSGASPDRPSGEDTSTDIQA
ncbi:MAG: hypothetical protein KDK25_15110 [Leptospiraceae bacterium]|nr:hypothetical protein [Leptospiraceae bacterium]MCB1171675.1 hypothetical protein [Leptospiraceae bacterium]